MIWWLFVYEGFRLDSYECHGEIGLASGRGSWEDSTGGKEAQGTQGVPQIEKMMEGGAQQSRPALTSLQNPQLS